jgi:hypothetical protein
MWRQCPCFFRTVQRDLDSRYITGNFDTNYGTGNNYSQLDTLGFGLNDCLPEGVPGAVLTAISVALKRHTPRPPPRGLRRASRDRLYAKEREFSPTYMPMLATLRM